MNLIIDIGNTVSKYYLFEGSDIREHGHQRGHSLGFLAAWLGGTAQEIHEPPTLQAAIVCAVVDLPAEAEERLRALPCPVLRFTPATPVPIVNAYHTPHSLGADRLAAAIGAHALCPGRPLLIVDSGSCITFDFVTAQGAYVGGNITPGLHARLQAIDQFFPRLPKVDAEGDLPELGYDTETAIRAGVIQGIRHETEGYIAHFRQLHPDLQVFLTGGERLSFQTNTDDAVHAEPHLVARGLAHILAYNQTLQTNQP